MMSAAFAVAVGTETGIENATFFICSEAINRINTAESE